MGGFSSPPKGFGGGKIITPPPPRNKNNKLLGFGGEIFKRFFFPKFFPNWGLGGNWQKKKKKKRIFGNFPNFFFHFFFLAWILFRVFFFSKKKNILGLKFFWGDLTVLRGPFIYFYQRKKKNWFFLEKG